MESKEKTKVVALGGRLNIYNIKRVHEKIETAMEKSEKLFIFFRHVKELDISFVQLLYSLLQDRDRNGPTLYIDRPQLLSSLLKSSGFASHMILEKCEGHQRYRIKRTF